MKKLEKILKLSAYTLLCTSSIMAAFSDGMTAGIGATLGTSVQEQTYLDNSLEGSSGPLAGIHMNSLLRLADAGTSVSMLDFKTAAYPRLKTYSAGLGYVYRLKTASGWGQGLSAAFDYTRYDDMDAYQAALGHETAFSGFDSKINIYIPFSNDFTYSEADIPVDPSTLVGMYGGDWTITKEIDAAHVGMKLSYFANGDVKDDIFSVGLGGDYTFNKSVTFGAGVEFRDGLDSGEYGYRGFVAVPLFKGTAKGSDSSLYKPTYRMLGAVIQAEEKDCVTGNESYSKFGVTSCRDTNPFDAANIVYEAKDGVAGIAGRFKEQGVFKKARKISPVTLKAKDKRGRRQLHVFDKVTVSEKWTIESGAISILDGKAGLIARGGTTSQVPFTVGPTTANANVSTVEDAIFMSKRLFCASDHGKAKHGIRAIHCAAHPVVGNLDEAGELFESFYEEDDVLGGGTILNGLTILGQGPLNISTAAGAVPAASMKRLIGVDGNEHDLGITVETQSVSGAAADALKGKLKPTAAKSFLSAVGSTGVIGGNRSSEPVSTINNARFVDVPVHTLAAKFGMKNVHMHGIGRGREPLTIKGGQNHIIDSVINADGKTDYGVSVDFGADTIISNSVLSGFNNRNKDSVLFDSQHSSTIGGTTNATSDNVANHGGTQTYLQQIVMHASKHVGQAGIRKGDQAAANAGDGIYMQGLQFQANHQHARLPSGTPPGTTGSFGAGYADSNRLLISHGEDRNKDPALFAMRQFNDTSTLTTTNFNLGMDGVFFIHAKNTIDPNTGLATGPGLVGLSDVSNAAGAKFVANAATTFTQADIGELAGASFGSFAAGTATADVPVKYNILGTKIVNQLNSRTMAQVTTGPATIGDAKDAIATSGRNGAVGNINTKILGFSAPDVQAHVADTSFALGSSARTLGQLGGQQVTKTPAATSRRPTTGASTATTTNTGADLGAFSAVSADAVSDFLTASTFPTTRLDKAGNSVTSHVRALSKIFNRDSGFTFEKFHKGTIEDDNVSTKITSKSSGRSFEE